ncbi:DUF6086 family protein [Streptomyces sp. SAS_270]|uniref:DUF6086 family protein n=1 Tax=Streptomyces sp. SAS_270 TaxID=3412748 RepID=UPI00403CD28C
MPRSSPGCSASTRASTCPPTAYAPSTSTTSAHCPPRPSTGPETSDQGILRSLSLGFIATSLVLIDRAGHPAPAMPGPAQELAWRTLRDQHARAMPVTCD